MSLQTNKPVETDAVVSTGGKSVNGVLVDGAWV